MDSGESLRAIIRPLLPLLELLEEIEARQSGAGPDRRAAAAPEPPHGGESSPDRKRLAGEEGGPG